MNHKLYEAHQKLEDIHWWFVGRRRVLGAIAEKFRLFVPGNQVLDAGCGTGGTLRWLKGQGIESKGFDPVDPNALYGRLTY